MMSTVLLVEKIKEGSIKSNHPKICAPERFKISLMPHQESILYAARLLETDNHDVLIHPQFAILADRAGAGKTIESLAIIACEPDLGSDNYTAGYGVSSLFQVRSEKLFIPINIIVCPPNIVIQWENMMDVTDLSVMVIPSVRHMRILLDKIQMEDTPEVVIVNSSAYKDLAILLSMYRVSRLFIDEVDKLEISTHAPMILARFTYFISATVENLIYANMPQSIFMSIMSNLHNCKELPHLILRSTQSFMEESMTVIAPIHYVKEFVVESHELLSKFADESVLEYILQDNYEQASTILGVELVPYTINKFQQRIFTSTNSDERAELSSSIQRLNRLLNEESRCCLCYDELSIAAITPCECVQKYCSFCLDKWLNKNNTCPTCRSIIHKSNVIYNYDKLSAPLQVDILSCLTPQDAMSKSKSKLECITNFIKYCIHERETTTIRRKIILFSSKNSYRELQNVMDHLEVSYQLLQGNVYKIANTVKRFKNDDLMFILANTNKFGRGLNLQECTDIFIYHISTDVDQLFSRAQRYGRSSQLNVYHMIYKQERLLFEEIIKTTVGYQEIE
jgi:hypothetical protein